MHPKQLEAVERWNLLLSAILIVGAAFFFDRRVTLGVIVGAGLSCLNFWGIHRLVLASMRVSGRKRNVLQILLGAKMAVLMLLVFLAVQFLPLNPVALAVGLSVFLVSIAIESVRVVHGRA